MNAKEARERTDKANGEDQMISVYSHIVNATQLGQYRTTLTVADGAEYIIERLKFQGYHLDTTKYTTDGQTFVILLISW